MGDFLYIGWIKFWCKLFMYVGKCLFFVFEVEFKDGKDLVVWDKIGISNFNNIVV